MSRSDRSDSGGGLLSGQEPSTGDRYSYRPAAPLQTYAVGSSVGREPTSPATGQVGVMVEGMPTSGNAGASSTRLSTFPASGDLTSIRPVSQGPAYRPLSVHHVRITPAWKAMIATILILQVIVGIIIINVVPSGNVQRHTIAVIQAVALIASALLLVAVILIRAPRAIELWDRHIIVKYMMGSDTISYGEISNVQYVTFVPCTIVFFPRGMFTGFTDSVLIRSTAGWCNRPVCFTPVLVHEFLTDINHALASYRAALYHGDVQGA